MNTLSENMNWKVGAKNTKRSTLGFAIANKINMLSFSVVFNHGFGFF